jgi:hypothetical protein
MALFVHGIIGRVQVEKCSKSCIRDFVKGRPRLSLDRAEPTLMTGSAEVGTESVREVWQLMFKSSQAPVSYVDNWPVGAQDWSGGASDSRTTVALPRRAKRTVAKEAFRVFSLQSTGEEVLSGVQIDSDTSNKYPKCFPRLLVTIAQVDGRKTGAESSVKLIAFVRRGSAANSARNS